MLAALLTLLYPERCAACDAFTAEAGLCAACAPSLYPLGSACPVCARPEESPVPVVCARCATRPPAFARAWAAFRYGGELATAVRRFKYGGTRGGGRLELTRALAALLAPTLAAAARDHDAIVAVPLHGARLAERGFSQAHVLAKAARRAARAPIPFLPFALTRTRATAVQAGLSRALRQRNVRDAFAARATDVLGRRVLLVDDVVTTGATTDACARALRRAGATSVAVLALARAEG